MYARSTFMQQTLEDPCQSNILTYLHYITLHYVTLHYSTFHSTKYIDTYFLTVSWYRDMVHIHMNCLHLSALYFYRYGCNSLSHVICSWHCSCICEFRLGCRISPGWQFLPCLFHVWNIYLISLAKCEAKPFWWGQARLSKPSPTTSTASSLPGQRASAFGGIWSHPSKWSRQRNVQVKWESVGHMINVHHGSSLMKWSRFL